MDKETQAKYAVKILNKKQIVAQKKVEWVNREKFLLDRMRHPNIVSLYFTFSDPQNLCESALLSPLTATYFLSKDFVLEFCDKGELLDHIRKVRRGSLKDLDGILCWLLSSLVSTNA